MNSKTNSLVDAIAVTAELMGATLSPGATKALAEQLMLYPEPWVIGALKRTSAEVSGSLRLADILSRLDDGRPSVEEAWALCARALNDEGMSLVWCEEMRIAFGPALNLSDDAVAARMAFKECYQRELMKARHSGESPFWSYSPGWYESGREEAQREAKRRNQLTLKATGKLPAPRMIEFQG